MGRSCKLITSGSYRVKILAGLRGAALFKWQEKKELLQTFSPLKGSFNDQLSHTSQITLPSRRSLIIYYLAIKA